jgi:hypothetical protein
MVNNSESRECKLVGVVRVNKQWAISGPKEDFHRRAKLSDKEIPFNHHVLISVMTQVVINRLNTELDRLVFALRTRVVIIVAVQAVIIECCPSRRHLHL